MFWKGELTTPMSSTSRKLQLLGLLIVSVLALLIIAVACGGDDDEEQNGGGATTPAGNGGGGETTFDMNMHEEGGNVFELGVEKNPTLKVPAGEEITINLDNQGIAIHNMRFAGDDNEYNSGDDAVSEPALVNGGQTATLVFTAPSEAGTYVYQCDFHPTDMKGEIEVE